MRWSAIIFACCLAFVAADASAVMTPLTTDQITKSSDMVIRGTVQNVECFWSEDGKTIMSRATISVNEVVRGQIVPSQLVVEFEGGEIGGLGYRVSDSAAFEVGEDTLLFLRQRARGSAAVQSGPAGQPDRFQLVGRAQGKYTIDPQGIARKRGFSVVGDSNLIDNNIPVQELMRKIREANK